MIEPLMMLESLLLVKMWSISEALEFCIRVARKLVRIKPELDALVK